MAHILLTGARCESRAKRFEGSPRTRRASNARFTGVALSPQGSSSVREPEVDGPDARTPATRNFYGLTMVLPLLRMFPLFILSHHALSLPPLRTTTGACAYAERLDASLANFWSWARETRVMRWDTFEPALVLTAFTVFLLGWGAVDLGLFGTRSWTTKYRLQPQGPPGKTHEEHSRRIWTPEGHGVQEFALYLLPLVAFDVAYPRRVLPEAVPSTAGVFVEVFACLLLYDALFAVTHRLMHALPWLHARVHAKHHLHRHVRAREIFRLSAIEEVVDTACSVAAVNVTRAHPLSRAVYNVLIVFLLCEIHSGYDFPWQLCNVIPGGWMMGSRGHVLHHITGRGPFAKFFAFLEVGGGDVGETRRRETRGAAR